MAQWHVRTGGVGQVVPPMRGGSRKRCDEHTLGKKLKDALPKVKLRKLTWYQATRHTFASHWVLAGGTIEKLREVMGHSTVMVTERYAHLRPDMFGAADRGRVAVDLSTPTGKILPLAAPAETQAESKIGAFGYTVVTPKEDGRKTGT